MQSMLNKITWIQCIFSANFVVRAGGFCVVRKVLYFKSEFSVSHQGKREEEKNSDLAEEDKKSLQKAWIKGDKRQMTTGTLEMVII
jgi:hypothetical protein